MNGIERLIEQAATVLSKAGEPLSLNEVKDEIDVEERREAKRVLREMMDRGLIRTTTRFKYRLSPSDSRPIDAEIDSSATEVDR